MIKVTCDKCGKEIKLDFIYTSSGFYTKCENRGEEFAVVCANGDDLVFCDSCYSKFVQCEEAVE